MHGLNDQLKVCRRIAAVAHTAKGQTRADGITPYIVHPERVAVLAEEFAYALGVHEENILSLKCAALLHDVIEDTGVEIKHLRSWGVHGEVIFLVDLMTKKNAANEPESSEYRKSLSDIYLGTILKCADQCANLEDVSRDVKGFGNWKRWEKWVNRTRDWIPSYERYEILISSFLLRLAAADRAILESKMGGPIGVFDCGDFSRCS